MKALFGIVNLLFLFSANLNAQKTEISQQMNDDYQKVHNHLYNELIPFWDKNAIDKQYGGFMTNFDANGKPIEMPEKYLNTQCRMIWWFSQLNKIAPSEASKSKAKQGVDFLIKYLWDSKNEGWRWKVKRDGSPVDDGKIVYGQSFAIYALSDYYISTGDKRGLEFAEKTFDLLQRYCADTHYGGYYENMETDWTPAQGGFSGGDRKGLDTHMHLMEAFTSLYLASGKELHKRKLIEMINLISEKMVDHENGSGLSQFDLAWNPLPGINIKRSWNAEREGEKPADPTELTSYGHNTELVWLMVRALKAVGESVDPYKPMFKQLLDNAVKYGVDFEKGGIYRDGLRKGGALILEKEWWQHTESLVGFLEGYELFGDVRYFEAFQAIWKFVDTKMINHEVGEWRRLLDRDGKVIDGNIGNEWKVAYHSGRSMVECEKRLNKLMQGVGSSSKKDYTGFVNRFIGSGHHGKIVPAAVVPFGMVQCGPNTREGDVGYNYYDTKIQGFSHVNKGGSGCSDFHDILFVPLNGSRWDTKNTIYPAAGFPTDFSHDNEIAQPGYYQVKMVSYPFIHWQGTKLSA